MREWLLRLLTRNEAAAKKTGGGEAHHPTDDMRAMSASDAPCAQGLRMCLNDEARMWEGHLSCAVLDRWLEMSEEKKREMYGDGPIMAPNALLDELHLSLVAVPVLVKHVKALERFIVRECIPEGGEV